MNSYRYGVGQIGYRWGKFNGVNDDGGLSKTLARAANGESQPEEKPAASIQISPLPPMEIKSPPPPPADHFNFVPSS